MIGLKVQNGIVVNAAVFESIPSGWVESDGVAGIGWLYDGSEFSAPVIVVPPLSYGDGTKILYELYESAMTRLSSNYSQKEIDTFPEKVAAAKAYASGSPETDDTYYLAKIDGVVNGVVPLNDAEIQAEVDGINAAGLLVVAERAQKILDARKAFNFWTAKIEQVRNTHLALLVEGEDNQPVVDALAVIYGAIQ